MKNYLLIGLLLLSSPTAFASAFVGNKMDDLFTVKSIAGGQATLDGKVKELKAGDMLYFARSPFQFSVVSAKDSQVVIRLPETHDLAIGNTLMRHPTDMVKKNLSTESKLKQALEE